MLASRTTEIRLAFAFFLSAASIWSISLLVTNATAGQTMSCGQGVGIAPAKVDEIAPGVYIRQGVHALMTAANRGAIANIGFVVGRDAVAVIDTGGSACGGARLRAAIVARTGLPIRYVINTHVHPDHIFGNAAFLADKPEFIGHHRLARALAMRGAYYINVNRERMGARLLEGTKIVRPTKSVFDTLTLDLGDRKLVLTANETAHTDHDLTVFDQKTATLWTGDLLFREHLPVVDGSLLGWLRVIDKLALLKVAWAIPGHGSVAGNWPDALAPQRRYLTTLANDLRKFIETGRTMSEAVADAAQSEKANWRLFNEFNSRNATAGFAELEWE